LGGILNKPAFRSREGLSRIAILKPGSIGTAWFEMCSVETPNAVAPDFNPVDSDKQWFHVSLTW
jgi:hypothetical protein